MSAREPVRVVWPIPRWVWRALKFLDPLRRYQTVYWAVLVEGDGAYEVTKQPYNPIGEVPWD